MLHVIESARIFNIHRSAVGCWLVLRETAAVSEQVLCTPFKQAPVYSVTLFKAIPVGCMCVFAVACHLYFWQNDRGRDVTGAHAPLLLTAAGHILLLLF